MGKTTLPDKTWRLLWTHATYQIISACRMIAAYERVAAGNGWGLRDPANHRRGLLIHPSGAGHVVGDLSLTVLGAGTYVIPRRATAYSQYLLSAIMIVEIVAPVCLGACLSSQAPMDDGWDASVLIPAVIHRVCEATLQAPRDLARLAQASSTA